MRRTHLPWYGVEGKIRAEIPVIDRALDNTDEPRRQAEQAAEAMLGQALRRARLSILWERLWPALAALATAIGLFVSVSWIGLWLWLPPIARAVGLFLFLVIT